MESFSKVLSENLLIEIHLSIFKWMNRKGVRCVNLYKTAHSFAMRPSRLHKGSRQSWRLHALVEIFPYPASQQPLTQLFLISQKSFKTLSIMMTDGSLLNLSDWSTRPLGFRDLDMLFVCVFKVGSFVFLDLCFYGYSQ